MVRIVNIISSWTHKVGSLILLPLMALIIGIDVCMRYLFNKPLLWSHEVNGLLLFMVLLFSIIECWNRDRHVRMEIFYAKFQGRLKTFAEVVTGLVGMFIFAILSIQSFRDIPYMFRTHETGEELGLPLWPFKLLLALVSLLFILKCGIHTVRALRGKENN